MYRLIQYKLKQYIDIGTIGIAKLLIGQYIVYVEQYIAKIEQYTAHFLVDEKIF